MKQNTDKMTLEVEDLAKVKKAHSMVIEQFLDSQISNVVGMGIGVKWKNGKPTGEPALVVLVTHKLDKDELSEADLIPSKLADMQTDVLAVGHFFAGGSASPETSIQTLTQRVRPAQGGYSIGHVKITAGTIAASVYDILPGGSTNPPVNGIGTPSKFYILSCNHVLANSNSAFLGDPVLQPGPFDGGVDPNDRIATLSRFIPITFEPPVPRASHNNLVDAAIAEGKFENLNRNIYWIDRVRGWRPKARVTTGTIVQKTGRTTNFNTGRITAVNATVDVSYGSGRVARFKDQIVTTRISAGGDSGSLVTTLDNVAVGLLFAGSSTATVLNQIENVRSLLRVEVAEQIL